MEIKSFPWFVISFIIVSATLFLFGYFYWKRPEVFFSADRRFNKRLEKYPAEYKYGAKEAYLRQIRAVGMGLFMGGFAVIALLIVVLVNPGLFSYMHPS